MIPNWVIYIFLLGVFLELDGIRRLLHEKIEAEGSRKETKA